MTFTVSHRILFLFISVIKTWDYYQQEYKEENGREQIEIEA